MQLLEQEGTEAYCSLSGRRGGAGGRAHSRSFEFAASVKQEFPSPRLHLG